MKLLRHPFSFIIFLSIILSIISLTSCIYPQNKMDQRVVVVVNGKTLTLKDFSYELARILKKYDAFSAKDPQQIKIAKEEIISKFIVDMLILGYCQTQSLVVTSEELEKEVSEFRSSYPDDPSFLRTLSDENLSLEQWKKKMETTLLHKKFLQTLKKDLSPPTEKEIQNYYNENRERYKRKESILLRQIVLDDLSKAQTIKDYLNKKPFDKLASEYSVAPEKNKGGLVGWVEKGTVDIFDKAFQLPVHGVSPVLESSYGFHIFKVEGKRAPALIPLSEVRKSIIQELNAKIEQNVFAQWIQKQSKISQIFRDQTLIDSVSIETKGIQK